MTDLSHWDNAEVFTGERAAALVVGIDPAELGYVRTTSIPIYERMESSYLLARARNHPAYENPYETDPPAPGLESRYLEEYFIREMSGDEHRFNNWLEDETRSCFSLQWFSRKELSRWLKACGLKSAYQFDRTGLTASLSNGETPLGTTERNTLLTIIAVLCKEAKLEYTTHAKTAGLILNTATGMGLSIGETTIEGHLKKIPNALASRLK
jgi:hypothetical protein